jgi:hypothetical protein
MLRRQKAVLESFQADAATPYDRLALNGLVELLDSIQDCAVDEAGIPEREVFGYGVHAGMTQAA